MFTFSTLASAASVLAVPVAAPAALYAVTVVVAALAVAVSPMTILFPEALFKMTCVPSVLNSAVMPVLADCSLIAETAAESLSIPLVAVIVNEAFTGVVLSPCRVSVYEPMDAMPLKRTSLAAVAVTPVRPDRELIWSAVALAVALAATVKLPTPR